MWHMEKGWWSQEKFINPQYYVMKNIASYKKIKGTFFFFFGIKPLVVRFLWKAMINEVLGKYFYL